ncbi:MAG: LPS-assembly protein LptD [Betaproteobacteria bacterium]|nr:LPS-assembly protein LptD [Betaproteobacteria bacterium]
MQLAKTRLAALLILAFGATLAGAQVPKPAAGPAPKGPTLIDAEKIDGVSELEVTARGKVELRRDEVNVFSEFLRYNQEFGRIEAEGGVRLERGSDRFFGPRLRYDTLNDTGLFEQPTFIFNRDQTARGGGEKLEFLGKNRVRLNKGHYTSCAPGKEDWRIEAGELELDYDAERGRAKDMRLRFMDTTALALPFASFPLNNRRKSGFLTPHYSQSSRRGFELGVPYYWNIAPEYDLTLTPSHMSKRGEQLKSHLRYLNKDFIGEARLEYLPDDRELNRSRSAFSMQHEHRFAPNFIGRLDYNRVSDDRYLVDFSSGVRAISARQLPREGTLTYSSGLDGLAYTVVGRLHSFQTLQDPRAPVAVPYDRLPQVNLHATRNDIGGLVDFGATGEYVRFAHPTLVEGSRTTFSPTLTSPLLAPGYFLTPKVGVRSTNYHLSRTAPGQPGQQSVNVPWLSADAGLIFEREASLFGDKLTQTLEPRAYYLYVPYRAQDQVPIFDTALADFNYASLFSENRFVGGDRFGDANQVTLALTSRMLSAQGQELFRATVGQRHYFKNERVALNATAPLRSVDSSDLLASVGGRFLRDWTFDGTMQYSTHESRAERYGAQLRYSPEIAKVINASYRFNRNQLRQVDVSGQWPIAQGWYAVGRYNYSFFDNRMLEGLGGVEYNGGCWVFRAVFSRVQASTQIVSSAVLFQLELNGLGALGSDEATTFLKRRIPGYAVTNPSDANLVPQSLRRPLPFEQIF